MTAGDRNVARGDDDALGRGVLRPVPVCSNPDSLSVTRMLSLGVGTIASIQTFGRIAAKRLRRAVRE